MAAARKNIVPLDPIPIPLSTSTGFVRSVAERRRLAKQKQKRLNPT